MSSTEDKGPTLETALDLVNALQGSTDPTMSDDENEDYLTADELRQRLREVTMACFASGVPFFEVHEIVQAAQDRWFSNGGPLRRPEVWTERGFEAICVPTPSDPDASGDHAGHDHVKGAARSA